MPSTKNFLAFDIGASNGRCMIGKFDGDKLSLDVLHRFDNGYVRVRDHLFWNILSLWENCKISLHKAAHSLGGNIAAIGVDTMGNDFSLLDEFDELIGNPYHYRDPQTTGMMEEVFKIIPRDEIFQITGLQFMMINSLYHLMAMVRRGSTELKIARTFLMIPDLLNFWLTGRKGVEYTNASIPQLMDCTQKQWAYPMLDKLGIPRHIFPEILQAGQVLEYLAPSLREETGLPEIPVLETATHDTAAAVAAVPAMVKNFSYLSSGTWGLLGAEVSRPILNEKVFSYNFGNEGGVFNTIRLLRNIVNMWLIQDCQHTWALEGETRSWEQLMNLAKDAQSFLAFIDPDEPGFLLPERMPSQIQYYCQMTGQTIPQTEGEIIRVCLESLAFKYRYTFEKLTDILGYPPEVLHIVGGAARNRMLNQFTANALARPVIAGPSEATSLGNLIVQMIGVGELRDLAEGRRLLHSSFPTENFYPQDVDIWEEQYARFLRVTGLPPIVLNLSR